MVQLLSDTRVIWHFSSSHRFITRRTIITFHPQLFYYIKWRKYQSRFLQGNGSIRRQKVERLILEGIESISRDFLVNPADKADISTRLFPFPGNFAIENRPRDPTNSRISFEMRGWSPFRVKRSRNSAIRTNFPRLEIDSQFVRLNTRPAVIVPRVELPSFLSKFRHASRENGRSEWKRRGRAWQ